MAGDEDILSEKDSMETDSLLNSRNETPEPMQIRTVSHKNDFLPDGPNQNIIVQNGLAKYNNITSNNSNSSGNNNSNNNNNTNGVRFNTSNLNNANEKTQEESQIQNDSLSKLSEFNNYSDPLSALINNMSNVNFAPLTKPTLKQAVSNMINTNNAANNQKNIRNHFGTDKTHSAVDLRLRSETANQANNNNNTDFSGRNETSSTSEMSSAKIKSILKRSSSFDTSLNVIGQQASLSNFALKTAEKSAGPRDSIELANSRMNNTASRIDSGDGRKKSVRFATQFMTSAASEIDSPVDDENDKQIGNQANQSKTNDTNCKIN
jgi:hypothetical protein